MDHRTGKQCRERYINHLDPDIKKTAWSPEEDDVIRDLFPEVGTKWSQYMASLPGRSDNAIKNRYHVICKHNFDSCSRSDSYSVASGRKRSMSDATSETDGHDDSSAAHSHSDESYKRLKRLHRARQMIDNKIRQLEDHTSFLTSHPSPSELSTTFNDADFMSDLEDFAFDWAEADVFLASETQNAPAEVPVAPVPELVTTAPTEDELLNVPFDFTCYDVVA